MLFNKRLQGYIVKSLERKMSTTGAFSIDFQIVNGDIQGGQKSNG